ncbi:MAG TPA: serine/threonine-protein kinase, partial [Gemmataceae bacterium]|nr:serine/threonine-protein kinase [Gemmataceae bacterium]
MSEDPTDRSAASPAGARISADETGDYSGDQGTSRRAAGPITGLDVSTELRAAFADRYVLGEKLGHGGYGSVFRAHDTRLNRAVAVKVSWIHTSDQDRILREARSLAQLRHPGIVTVYDVAVTRACCLVVSELLAGPSLAKWLEANQPTPAEAARVVAAVADALAHAHARSIVHRDVKPANIVFADDRRPVLVDFGLALTDLDTEAEHGVVSGTPAFMSPEQAGGLGHRPDGRTDVYGLAATLYAMLGGRPPFRGRAYLEVLRQVLEDDPQPLRQIRPDVSPEVEQVCHRGMAKLPGDRYTTAADLAEALRRAAEPGPARARPESPPTA